MSQIIRKSHNKSILLYHYVCPAKYRRVIFDIAVDKALKEVCLEISKRYEIIFLEIGTDKDHVHFLIQSVPTYSPSKIIQIIKSITAREIFKRVPEVRKQLWGVNFGQMVIFPRQLVNMAQRKSLQNMCENRVRKNITNNCINNLFSWSYFEQMFQLTPDTP